MSERKRMKLQFLGCSVALAMFICAGLNNAFALAPPVFDNNPQFDMILTNSRPILSVGITDSMPDNCSLEFEISRDRNFPPGNTVVYKNIRPQNKYIAEKQVSTEHALKDGTYYWRVRTVGSDGKTSFWVQTRFHIDVKNSRTFSGFMRAPVKKVSVSNGQDPKNIKDWNDQGQITFWNSAPRAEGEEFSWVIFDMGKKTPVTRFWMLSTRQSTSPAPGWLTHFIWQSSDDGRNWKDIKETEVKNNDTYRNIIDFPSVNARFYRLVIYDQNALQAQLNVIIPYVKGKPAAPAAPDKNYVLIIGNQMNGYTYTQLAKFVENETLQTLVIPYYEMSLEVLNSLKKKPSGIIFSGNNADWQNLPMFEYYGEFEIIRKVRDIPMMGICAGNEFIAMAYGISFAHWMGWFDDTMFRHKQGETPDKVNILPEYENDPIFKGVPNPFRQVEIHSWAISPLFLKDPRYNEFKVTAKSSYIQCIKSTSRPIYSEQFHGAVVNDYNQSGIYLKNFLKIVKSR